jgi:hypothetical protein
MLPAAAERVDTPQSSYSLHMPSQRPGYSPSLHVPDIDSPVKVPSGEIVPREWSRRIELDGSRFGLEGAFVRLGVFLREGVCRSARVQHKIPSWAVYLLRSCCMADW